MSVTLRDIGRHSGVSAMTVSRVINGAASVDPETRRKVEEAIEALGYIPNRVARSLTSQKTATIGLILRDIANPFYSAVARGAESAARVGGYRILLCNSEGDLRLEREYIDDLVSHRVEGLLLAPASDHSRHNVQSLLRRDFPITLIDSDLPDVDCDLLVADNATGAQRLVEHLIALGHRDIAHVGDAEDTYTGRERLQGYRNALAAHDIPYRDDLVVRATVDQIGGYRATQEILALDPLPTAIFAVNNMTAVGAMQALRERGITVPEDIALVCFDDIEHLAVLSPFLTVVDQPAELFGKLAAQLLLERIAGKAGPRSRRIVLQTNLIVRTSCGSKAGLPKRGG